MEKQIALINNPDYLQQQVWPLVVELADILKTPGMSAHSLMSYFLYGINAGVELWGAIKDGKCIGFMSLIVCSAPYYSTGSPTYIYMKEKDEELVNQLYKKFGEFLKKYNLKYFMFSSQSKKLIKHFETKHLEMGLKTLKTQYLCMGKRTIGGK